MALRVPGELAASVPGQARSPGTKLWHPGPRVYGLCLPRCSTRQGWPARRLPRASVDEPHTFPKPSRGFSEQITVANGLARHSRASTERTAILPRAPIQTVLESSKGILVHESLLW